MSVIERGKVRQGQIVLEHPLNLEEGTEVVVHIEPLPTLRQGVPASQDLRDLEFFGMWSSRDDMADSVQWVRKERERWKERLEREE